MSDEDWRDIGGGVRLPELPDGAVAWSVYGGGKDTPHVHIGYAGPDITTVIVEVPDESE